MIKNPQNATPSEIVKYLDDYVIGQDSAKRTIALALRTRYRRMRLSPEIKDDVMPKNILMIGSTGVGKTEIARRLAKIMNFPFIKVEASKYTEVGYVGRDVESMIRDLVLYSHNMVKQQFQKDKSELIENYITEKILDKLVPQPPKNNLVINPSSDYESVRDRMRTRLNNGDLNERKITIELSKMPNNYGGGEDSASHIEIIKIQESLTSMFDSMGAKKESREVTVREARELLKNESAETILDKEEIRKEAIRKASEEGIIFIDEIDKIAVGGGGSNGKSDPSKEGVQRDLLPIVEGSTVNTKLGQIKTDHILFISAGAFHVSKPSDLIPELQGRFPLRVELESLNEELLYKILTQPKNSLLKQYIALLEVEGVELKFHDSAIRSLAKLAQRANEKTEDIGARRLHTVIEKVLEKISFKADELKGQIIEIKSQDVEAELSDFISNEDLAHYIL